jgi:hypothetical protein
MEKMIEDIQSTSQLKKSLQLATGLALDYQELTGAGAGAMMSSGAPRRRKRNGEAGDIGVFIKTQAFKVSWYKFFTRKSAHEFVNASKDLVDRNDRSRLASITPVEIDRGVLETLNFLKERNSPLTHTKEAYKILTFKSKFGL